jgi:hypothetical protein
MTFPLSSCHGITTAEHRDTLARPVQMLPVFLFMSTLDENLKALHNGLVGLSLVPPYTLAGLTIFFIFHFNCLTSNSMARVNQDGFI